MAIIDTRATTDEAVAGLDEQITVAELIRTISDELVESRAQRIRDGRPPVFEVEGLDIEISFVVTRSRTGSAGVDLKVVQAGGQGLHEQQAVQKLTLHLTAARDVDTSSEFVDFDATEPLRPRRRLTDGMGDGAGDATTANGVGGAREPS